MTVETETLLDTSERSWRRRLKAFAAHAGLLFLLIAYTVFGGFVFKSLEYPTEIATLARHGVQVKEQRAIFIDRVAEIREKMPEREFRRILDQQLSKYEGAVQDAAKGGLLVPINEGQEPESLARWNNVQAIFFAATVLTTIGYGNIVPVTVGGRTFCLLFALIGIPLCVSVIADLGSIVANRFTGLPNWLEKVSTTVKSLLSALLALTLLLVYISMGAVLFMFLEGEWTFFESFYFCFITMTTIGFGDLVPQKPEYMLLCTIYILIGLGMTSTIIEIVRNEYAKSWQRIQALADALRKLAEMGGSATEIANLQNEFIQRITMTPSSKSSKQFENAVDTIVRNMSKKTNEPKMVQIIIYETSV
ncbi:Ion channel [Nesidiocoris tenuis]|uniref:Ion channel n=1 Tax=Nesidiocoris tenuis TaxID=355587 RepID=A0ABN7BC61_9HEMI|nr:Ion channel [Nesidiocoris tenuis]